MALPPGPVTSLTVTEPQSLPGEELSQRVDIGAPASASIEPLLSVAGGSWRLVWALTPADPGAAAGLWPGTPWPGNPGRSVIGVLADLSTIQPGTAFVLDDEFWTVFHARIVDPGDWETVVETPVEAAEVCLYELGDTPGRGRATLLARLSGGPR